MNELKFPGFLIALKWTPIPLPPKQFTFKYSGGNILEPVHHRKDPVLRNRDNSLSLKMLSRGDNLRDKKLLSF